MKPPRIIGAALAMALMSAGCGYRIVRNSDVTATRSSADSATMSSLTQQLSVLRAQCHDDSVRMTNDLAAQRAASSAPAASTSLQSPSSDSLLKARTAEVAALRDQLTKVNAELDRIKRRLANPRG